jgi:uncharacterized protein
MTGSSERYGQVTVERDLAVPMPDGTILRADLWRPIGAGSLPVLLSRQPYDKRQAQALTFAHPAWYARRGYVAEPFPTWPPPDTQPRPLWLAPEGRANTADGDGRLLLEPPPGPQPPDLYVADPAFPIRSAAGHSCCFAELAPTGPADQSAVEDHTEVLCYTSPPLDRPLLLAGEVTLELWAQTSTPDTDWAAKLCVVGHNGRSVNLPEGIVRARLAAGAGDGAVGSEPRCYRVRLGHLCAGLTAGERLRLQLTSSNLPHWDRNLGTGQPVGRGTLADRVVATQAVWHAADTPSRLRVPVLSGGWWP